jgi:hypothetical protein
MLKEKILSQGEKDFDRRKNLNKEMASFSQVWRRTFQ